MLQTIYKMAQQKLARSFNLFKANLFISILCTYASPNQAVATIWSIQSLKWPTEI
jgi:hypothetical protein